MPKCLKGLGGILGRLPRFLPALLACQVLEERESGPQSLLWMNAVQRLDRSAQSELPLDREAELEQETGTEKLHAGGQERRGVLGEQTSMVAVEQTISFVRPTGLDEALDPDCQGGGRDLVVTETVPRDPAQGCFGVQEAVLRVQQTQDRSSLDEGDHEREVPAVGAKSFDGVVDLIEGLAKVPDVD